MNKPTKNCNKCPRLFEMRSDNKKKWPEKFNAPVPSFGDISAELLIVGLAPGLKGANFTGRPFTGDGAGDILYDTLIRFGFADGQYASNIDDGLTLNNCRITNALRCVPPQNKPTSTEMKNCCDFLRSEIAAMKSLRIIISLGKISHDSVLNALNVRKSLYKFSHGAMHRIDDILLLDSYHCSRYNTSTKRLTGDMFDDIFTSARNFISSCA